MPNFTAKNDFNCPYCHEMLNGATGFSIHDKPQHDSFTICVFCASVCVYAVNGDKISLRKTDEKDELYIKNNNALRNEIEALKEFVKTNPNK